MLVQSEHFRRYAFLIYPQYRGQTGMESARFPFLTPDIPLICLILTTLCSIINRLDEDGKILSSAWIFLMLSTMLSVDAVRANEWHFHVLNPLAGTSKSQYTHTHLHCDMLVYNRCHYLNIQLWYSAKAEYLAGARYAPTISIIYLKKRHRRLKRRLNCREGMRPRGAISAWH